MPVIEPSSVFPSLDNHSEPYLQYNQSEQYQSRAVLETIHGELRNLASLIEQELSQKQDASCYLQGNQLASYMDPRLDLAAHEKWGPSAVPPAIPMRSYGDNLAARISGIGPSAAPPVPPSYGDRTMERELTAGFRFNAISQASPDITLSAPTGAPSHEQYFSTMNGWRTHGEQEAGDKYELPQVPEEHEERYQLRIESKQRNSLHSEQYLQPRLHGGSHEDLSNVDWLQFLTTQQTNQYQRMFNALTEEHQTFLTVDDSLQILQWSAPEREWERATVENILTKLDAEAKTFGRGSVSAFGEATCDFRSFCFLLGRFDPKSFDDPEDAYMKDNLSSFKKAIRAKAKQKLRLLEEEKYRISSAIQQAEEEKSPFNGKIGLAFDTVPAFVILGNAIVIGVSADVESESVVWEVFELFFLVFFTAEFVLKARLAGLMNMLGGPDKWWNFFDLFCIVTAVIDQFFVYLERFSAGGGVSIKDVIPISLVKMLKLVRLARLVRLLRFKIFHELRMMVQGVVSGVKVLFWAIVLLFFVVFILGIVMRKMVGDEQTEFSTLFAAMFTLFRCFTDGCSAYDGTPLSERLRQNLGPTTFGIVWMIAYILVILFVTIGIFNLIMAIFIDNVVTAQMQRKQQKLGETADAMELRIHEVIGARFQIRNAVHAGAPSQDHSHDEKSLWGSVVARLSLLTDANQYTEEGRREQLEQRRSMVASALQELDGEERVVTRAVFSEWLKEKEILDFLEEVDVETSTRWELFDALDVDGGGELTVDELVSGLMKLRGPISKNDIVATRLKLTYVTELVEDICRKLEIKLSCDKETTALVESSWSQW